MNLHIPMHMHHIFKGVSLGDGGGEVSQGPGGWHVPRLTGARHTQDPGVKVSRVKITLRLEM